MLDFDYRVGKTFQQKATYVFVAHATLNWYGRQSGGRKRRSRSPACRDSGFSEIVAVLVLLLVCAAWCSRRESVSDESERVGIFFERKSAIVRGSIIVLDFLQSCG